MLMSKIKILALFGMTIFGILTASSQGVAPDEEDPYFLLSEEADRAISEGDYESAAARIREAISLRPGAIENVLLLSNLGMVYSYMDCDSMALSAFNEALSRAPSMTTVLFNRARVLLKIGEDESARADLDKVLEADSLNVEALFLRGMSHLNGNDLAAAEKDFGRMQRTSPDSNATALAMTSLYTAQNKLKEALPYVRKVIVFDPQPEYYLIAAQALIEDTRYSEAGRYLSEGIEKYPTSAPLYSMRATLYKLQYDRKAAEADERKVKELMRSRPRR